jgi:hypothetical protein
MVTVEVEMEKIGDSEDVVGQEYGVDVGTVWHTCMLL